MQMQPDRTAGGNPLHVAPGEGLFESTPLPVSQKRTLFKPTDPECREDAQRLIKVQRKRWRRPLFPDGSRRSRGFAQAWPPIPPQRRALTIQFQDRRTTGAMKMNERGDDASPSCIVQSRPVKIKFRRPTADRDQRTACRCGSRRSRPSCLDAAWCATAWYGRSHRWPGRLPAPESDW